MQSNDAAQEAVKIAEMRKQGELDAAYAASEELMQKWPGDRHARLTHGKSVKALMERDAAAGDLDALVERLGEYAGLDLVGAGDPEAANKTVWAVRAFVLGRKQQDKLDFAEAARLFEALRGLDFMRPHRYYSILLDAFLQFREPKKGDPWIGNGEFIEWWGLENLREEDFQKTRMTNGMMIPSLAERAYSTYYQTLRARLDEGRGQDEAAAFVTQLDALLETHPEFQHTLYHKTRLLKSLGRTDEAVGSAAAFVLKRPSDFWSWSMLGDLVEDDAQQLACYCRALQCRADLRFLGKVKQKAAERMYRLGHLVEARHELEDVMRIYNQRGWHMHPEIAALATGAWWDQTPATESNRQFYMQFGQQAEALLYSGMPDTPVMITSYNPQKQCAGFVTADQRRGYFSTRKLPHQFGEFQIYRVRFDGNIPETAPAKVLTCERETDVAQYEGIFYRHETGELKWRPGQSFGFVGTTFVDGRLLGDWASTGLPVALTSVIYWHLKSGQWAWKAVTIRPQQ